MASSVIAPAHEAGHFRELIFDDGSINVSSKVINLKKDLPTIAIFNTTMNKYILLDVNEDGQKSFSFTSPGFAASFTSPNQSVFATAPDGSNYVFVMEGGAGFGAGGGGVVSAGSTTLSLNYVLCFSADEESLGGDLFNFGGPDVDGFSGAVGISGDFEALSTGDFDEDQDPLDFFFGMALYYILDDNPSGSYDVVSFMDEAGDTNLNEYAFAILISFQNGGGLYFSNDGELSFSGSSASFDGTYLGIENFTLGFGEDVDEDVNFVEVDGFGTINCN